jgi:hypothetical protein
MRKELEKIDGVRTRFTGIVAQFGKKENYRGRPSPTVMLKSVRKGSGQFVTDHLWFVIGKRFEAIQLEIGDKIQFDARVKEYTKGYKGYRDIDDEKPIETDYKLSHPTNIIKIEKNNSSTDKKSGD